MKANPLIVVALVVLLAAGLASAVALAWVCDDSFISIRYADNLVHGHGLVYNAGERVEGYTNLLWTLILAAFIRAGASPVTGAEFLGVVAYGAVALCLTAWAWRRGRDADRTFLPLAAALVLVSDDFHVWATGGLETMFFTYLALQALLLTRLECSTRRLPLLAGGLFGLLVLTRPDGLLLAGAGAVSYWVRPGRLSWRRRLDSSLSLLVPVAVVLGVLVPFKLAYYGDIFPTAFYSKSVLDPYYTQGLLYVGLYLAKNWFLVVAFALALAAGWLGGRHASSLDRWHAVVFLGTCGIFTAYLVHAGGDFMFARRLIPVVPLVFLVLEDLIARLRSRRTQVVLALVCVLAAALPLSLYSAQRTRIQGIADERLFYPERAIEARKRQAEVIGGALAGTNARVAFEGGMCVFGYYSRLPYLVEMTGLTQYSLAKRPLAQRGYIGHEKAADEAWLRENNIHLMVSHKFPPVALLDRRFDEVYFDGIAKARIVIYSDEVMDHLRGNSLVRFTPIERLIEQRRAEISHASVADAERIFEELYQYYFRGAGERSGGEARTLLDMIERKRRESSLRQPGA